MNSRRLFLQSAGASLVFASAGWAQADPLQNLLARKAAPLRGIDAKDEDFSDLEPLGAAIGQARVVQLGEPSHGAGSAFAAKARIAKFLHQKHGFDVLVWESGLYDVALAQAAMRDPGTDAMAAARKGVFALWSEAAEVKPLFEHIKASQTTLLPLEMAGFDMQVTANGSRERFAEDLRIFVGALAQPSLRATAMALAESAIAARQRLYAGKFAGADDLALLGTAVRDLRGQMAAQRIAFASGHGPLEISFMDRCLENMHSDALLRAEAARAPETTPARESRRDAWNAANLRWLLTERYAGRKAIVWAHNVHVMDGYYAPGFRDVRLQGRPGDMKTTGVFLKQWLRDDVYTLGVTTYAGEEAFAMGGPKKTIAPAPDSCLEARLHSLGHPFAFLDLRPLRKEAPLRNLPMRTPKFDVNILAEPGRLYDGVFFIDRMDAATRA